MELWKEADAKRQNFISLPGPDLQSFRTLGAEPQDRAALTRQLLQGFSFENSGLCTPLETEALKIAARFWTEHSSRATLVTMARALMVPKAVTDKLGWWAVGSQASEEYIRSYRVLIAKVQKNVARFIRTAILQGDQQDIFGEALVLEDLKAFMLTTAPTMKVNIIKCLTKSLSTFSATSSSEDFDIQKVVWKEDNMLDAIPPTLEKGISDIMEDDSEPEVVTPANTAVPGVGTWIVSLGASHSTYCLHIVGNCYRLPTVHFKHWQVVQDPVPTASYRRTCQKCFPRGYPIISPDLPEAVEATMDLEMPDEVAGSDESSSSSDSS